MQCDSGKCDIRHRRLLRLTTKNDKHAGFVDWSTGILAFQLVTNGKRGPIREKCHVDWIGEKVCIFRKERREPEG